MKGQNARTSGTGELLGALFKGSDIVFKINSWFVIFSIFYLIDWFHVFKTGLDGNSRKVTFGYSNGIPFYDFCRTESFDLKKSHSQVLRAQSSTLDEWGRCEHDLPCVLFISLPAK